MARLEAAKQALQGLNETLAPRVDRRSGEAAPGGQQQGRRDAPPPTPTSSSRPLPGGRDAFGRNRPLANRLGPRLADGPPAQDGLRRRSSGEHDFRRAGVGSKRHAGDREEEAAVAEQPQQPQHAVASSVASLAPKRPRQLTDGSSSKLKAR